MAARGERHGRDVRAGDARIGYARDRLTGAGAGAGTGAAAIRRTRKLKRRLASARALQPRR
jgi:hypothetical protein